MSSSLNAQLGVAAVLLLVLATCQSSSPTELRSYGPTFNISVLASPSTLTAGASASSIVTIRVTRLDNNQPPPDGTYVLVTTTLGWLGSLDISETSVYLGLVNGQVQVVFFPGMSPGTATIRAQIDSSYGMTSMSIV